MTTVNQTLTEIDQYLTDQLAWVDQQLAQPVMQREVHQAYQQMKEFYESTLENLHYTKNRIQQLVDENRGNKERLKNCQLAEKWWRVLAMQVGLGETSLDELKQCAFAEILGSLPKESWLDDKLEELTTRLEEFENTSEDRPLRSIQLDKQR